MSGLHDFPALSRVQRNVLIGRIDHEDITALAQLISPPSFKAAMDFLETSHHKKSEGEPLSVLALRVRMGFSHGLSPQLEQDIRCAILAWRHADPAEKDKNFEIPSFVAKHHQIAGRTREALRACNTLDAWGRQRGLVAAQAAASLRRGIALLSTDNPRSALIQLERARSYCEIELQNRRGRAFCLQFESVAWRKLGDTSAAKSKLTEAIAEARLAEEIVIFAACQLGLGNILTRLGQLNDAAAAYKSSLSVALACQDRIRQYNALLGLFFVNSRVGQETSTGDLDQLEHDLGEGCPPINIGLSSEYRGVLASLTGDDYSALLQFRRSLRLAQKVGSISNRTETHAKIASLWIERGARSHAAHHLQKALTTPEELTEPEDTLALERIRHEIGWLDGRGEEAIEALTAHAKKVADLGFGYEHLLTARRIGTIADSIGRKDLAREWWARTEFLAEQCGAEPMLERWKKKRAELGFGPEAVTNEPRKESESPLAEELPPVDLEPHGIVTRSPKLQEYAAWLGRVAPTRLPILIRGESGTGKELFARMVHNLSDRADGPYISVNCAALPRDIIESELFGHRRGAFTGATEEKSGLFLAAHKGTIFLDEIGEMSSLLQAKLLRVLEDGEVRRLGDTHTRRVDVRIVAATNVAIEKAVQNGSFRKDLYYRLRGMEVFLPSLRERLEDVVPLAQRFVEEACARFGKRVTLPIGTATWLMGRHWDGNVRELRNAVEQAVAICGNGKEILPYHFGTATAPEASAPSLTDDLDAIEASRIRNALDAAKWNKTEAAKLLGVSRTTLNGKMNRLEIRPPKKH